MEETRTTGGSTPTRRGRRRSRATVYRYSITRTNERTNRRTNERTEQTDIIAPMQLYRPDSRRSVSRTLPRRVYTMVCDRLHSGHVARSPAVSLASVHDSQHLEW